ncbi:MAG: helix-turn-helix domain-containing protein [Planctomycetaceae bacterium]
MATIAIEPNVFYTLDEVAQLLRVSRAAALRLIKSGRAPAVQIGRQWRVLGAALLNLGDASSDSESEHVRDWWAASNKALQEVWDNDEDAVYDQL